MRTKTKEKQKYFGNNFEYAVWCIVYGMHTNLTEGDEANQNEYWNYVKS